MLLYHIYAFILFAATAFAATGEPCIGAGGRAGVCVTGASCRASGGSAGTVGTCARPAAGVVCCTKASCSNTAFKGGNCRWTSDCAGGSPGLGCPGGKQFVCCRAPNGHYGGYSAPRIPAVGSCKAQSVAGARKIVAAFPGRIREIGCYRSGTCSEGNEHPCGRAIDLMCSDAAGLGTNGGTYIAEWVMNNSASLRLKYVIWGQRIWNPSRDKRAPWSQWRTMPDRGSITQNHWDHVHVSFN